MAKKSKSSVDVDVNVKGKGVKKTQMQMKNLGEQTDKASKSQGELNRNWKGASKQSSGAAKNFSKLSQGMGGIVGGYAMLAANIFAIGAAFRFLESAGDLAKLKEGQILYASSTGIALKSLAQDIRDATDAQITFTDASQSAAIGKAAGLTNDQLVRLGKGAKDVSIILGRDVTDSFNRLVRGVTKAEPELLDELGIILRLADASEKYGAMIGKSAQDLTQFEKSQAIANEVLEQVEGKYGRIMAIMDPAGNQFTQLGVAFDDLTNKLKEYLGAIAQPIAGVLTAQPKLIVGLLLAIGNTLIRTSLTQWTESASASAAKYKLKLTEAKEELVRLQMQGSKKIGALAGTKGAEKGLADVAGREGWRPEGFKSSAWDKAIAGKGRELTSQQLVGMKAAVRSTKDLTTTMKNTYIAAINAMLVETKKVTAGIDADFQETGVKFKIVIRGMQAVWTGSMVVMKTAVAGLTFAMTKLMGWIAMASMVYTFGKAGWDWFKGTKESAEDVIDPLDIAGAKVKSLNEEFEKFNAVQRIIIEDGEGFLQFFESLANKIGSLSIEMQGILFEEAAGGFEDFMGQTANQFTALIDGMTADATSFAGIDILGGKTFEEVTGIVEELKASIATLETEGALVREAKLGDVSDYHGSLMDPGGIKKDTDARVEVDTVKTAAAILAATKELEEMEDSLVRVKLAQSALNGNFLDYLKITEDERLKDFGVHLEGMMESARLAAEAFGDKADNPVTQYLEVLTELRKMKRKDVGGKDWNDLMERIFAAQSAAQAFGATIASVTRLQKDNTQEVNKALLDTQKRSTEGRIVDNLQQEIDLREELSNLGLKHPAGMSKEAIKEFEERSKIIERQRDLFELIDRQKAQALKRTKTQSAVEKRIMIGQTKLVAARLKLEMALMKEEDKKLKIQGEIMAIRGKIVEMNGVAQQQQVDMLNVQMLELANVEATTDALERKLDLHKQIVDSAKQAFESEMTKGFAAFMKGEQSSFTEAIENLAQGIWDAVADTISKQLSEMVMTAIWGPEADEAEQMKSAMMAGADYLVTTFIAALRKEYLDKEAAIAAQEKLDAFTSGSGVIQGEQNIRPGDYDPNADKGTIIPTFAMGSPEEIAQTAATLAVKEAAAAANALGTKSNPITVRQAIAFTIAGPVGVLIDSIQWNDLVTALRQASGQTPDVFGTRERSGMVPYTSPDLSSLDPELKSKIEAITSLDRFSRDKNVPDPMPVVVTNPEVGVLRKSDTSFAQNLENYPGDVDRSTLGGTVMPAWLQPGQMDTREAGDIALETAEKQFYEAGLKKDSIFVHDTHVVAALHELLGDGIAGTALAKTTETKPSKPSWADTLFGKDREKKPSKVEEDKPSWGDTLFGKDREKINPLMSGTKAPGSVDAFGNPIGKPIEKEGGFLSKLTGFFSADSPWMTKLGDFFGGEGSFLSGLGGIFGGLGDMFSQLMGGPAGSVAMGGIMSILSTMFAGGGIAVGGFRKFARGGIATSPTLGLIGEGRHNEAVVPLPNGKGIPVDMRSSAQNNNVTVNVTSDGQTTTSGEDSEGLGLAIAKAVQEELQNQKRAGGILNRYGTA